MHVENNLNWSTNSTYLASSRYLEASVSHQIAVLDELTEKE
jgi:hypothetical protein